MRVAGRKGGKLIMDRAFERTHIQQEVCVREDTLSVPHCSGGITVLSSLETIRLRPPTTAGIGINQEHSCAHIYRTLDVSCEDPNQQSFRRTSGEMLSQRNLLLVLLGRQKLLHGCFSGQECDSPLFFGMAAFWFRRWWRRSVRVPNSL